VLGGSIAGAVFFSPREVPRIVRGLEDLKTKEEKKVSKILSKDKKERNKP